MPVPTLLTEWGNDSAATTGTTEVLTVPSNLPIGTLVVVSMTCIAALNPTFTIADSVSPDNTWVKSNAQVAAATTNTVMFSSILTTALPASSTVTITSTQTMTRRASAAAAFSDGFTAPTTHGAFNETSTTTVTGGTHTPAATALVFAALGYVSPARIFTPGAGYTAYTKHASTAGSGNRGVQIIARAGVAATPYATIGTLDFSGVCLTGLGSIAVGAPVDPWIPGVLKYWDGSAWITPDPTTIKYWDGSAWQQVPEIKVYSP